MSVSTNGATISYSPNGSTTAFAFPYMFEANADLVVQTVIAGVLSTKVLGTDYTVTGAGVSNGGTVTFGVAPASGTNNAVIITRATNQVQSTTFVDNAAFPAVTMTFGLDVLTLMVQDLQAQLNALKAQSQNYQSAQFSGWSGNGNTPNGLVVGNLGDTVIDVTTGYVWKKITGSNGTNTGWS